MHNILLLLEVDYIVVSMFSNEIQCAFDSYFDLVDQFPSDWCNSI